MWLTSGWWGGPMTKKKFIDSDFIASLDSFGFHIVGVKVGSSGPKYNMFVMDEKRIDLVHRRHGYKSMRGALLGGARWAASQVAHQPVLFSLDTKEPLPVGKGS